MATIILDTRQLTASKCQVPGCTSKGPFYRHHKGCDHMIGKYNKDIRERYYEYNDCCTVCDSCHMKIHFIYMPTLRLWQKYTPDGVLELRQVLIHICDRILAGDIPLKKPTKEFKDRWKKKHKAWKRSRKKR